VAAVTVASPGVGDWRRALHGDHGLAVTAVIGAVAVTAVTSRLGACAESPPPRLRILPGRIPRRSLAGSRARRFRGQVSRCGRRGRSPQPKRAMAASRFAWLPADGSLWPQPAPASCPAGSWRYRIINVVMALPRPSPPARRHVAPGPTPHSNTRDHLRSSPRAAGWHPSVLEPLVSLLT
jgi:hypothetical protein